jgi:hypothetical protein
MIEERQLSAQEWKEYKSGNRSTRRAIMRGRRIRENSALEEKIRYRKIRAKRRARLERKRLRTQERTPMIRVAG